MLVSPFAPASQNSSSQPEPPTFTRSTNSNVGAWDIIWGNSKWDRLSQGKKLLDCIDIPDARRLGVWLSGRYSELRSDATMSGEEETVVDHELTGLQNSLRRASLTKESDVIAATAVDVCQTLTITLGQLGDIKLELVRTTLPILRPPQGSSPQITVKTHSFVVITTIPRSHHATQDPLGRSSLMSIPLPSAASIPVDSVQTPKTQAKVLEDATSSINPLTRATRTGADQEETRADEGDVMMQYTEEQENLDRPPASLFFDRDGTVNKRKSNADATGNEYAGRSLDVHELLETTDWAKTSLGPKDQWPQSLRTIGEHFGILTSTRADYSLSPHAIPSAVRFVVG